jgi:hypothetical protein
VVYPATAQIVSIPDPAFKQALLDHIPVIDTNGDNEIQVQEAEAHTGGLFVFGTEADPGDISDLTGIEAFTSVDRLICSYNQLTAIDLGANPAMTELISIGNPLQSLEVAQNTALTNLFVVGHAIDELDLSPNTNLVDLIFIQGGLSQLILGDKPDLLSLAVQGNQLSQLDVSGLPAVDVIDAGENQLSAIDLSQNLALRRVFLDANELQQLDLSSNADLQAVNVASNPLLQSMNLKNANNQGMDLSGASNACNFQNTPGLEIVCLDDETSALAAYIQDQTAQQVTITQNCDLGTTSPTQDWLVLSPNPVIDRVYIRATAVISQAEVYDITGKLLVKRSSAEGLRLIDMSGLKTGVYLLRFSSQNNQTTVKRVIKTN